MYDVVFQYKHDSAVYIQPKNFIHEKTKEETEAEEAAKKNDTKKHI